MTETALRLVILGAGEFAEEVADLVAELPGARVERFAVNTEGPIPTHVAGCPVSRLESLRDLTATHTAICAIGSSRRRKIISQAEAMGFRFATLIHPAARVANSARIDEGAIVGAGCVIAARSRVGAHTIVNRGVLLGHHVEIGRWANLGPGANVGGGCRIGDMSLVAMGAIVMDHLEVGEGAIVGAGALATKSVPARTQVVGVPAKIVKEDVEPY